MTENESAIEKNLIKRVKELNGFCRKYTSPGRRGVPDQIVFLPGGTARFVELKTKRGVLSAGQTREIKRMQHVGITVAVLNSKGAVDICLTDWTK